jgi:NAD(P)-dependent dehydrogenase (short-subunit alcohol dehydrogenase family)
VREVVPRGRASIYSTPEEAAAAQREQQRLAVQAQRQAKRDARLAGLPEPSYRRGRRRIYATKEESIAAKRLGDPREFGATCAFVCSAHAGFMSGMNIHLDGGSYPALV